MIDVRIQAGDFDPGKQLQRLSELGKAGVASFVGIIEAQGDVTGTTIEHYAVAGKNELTRIAEEAEQKWGLDGVILIHRYGQLSPGERVLFAAAAAPDPVKASTACAFLVEALRTRAPFWRQDRLASGTTRWFEGD